MSSERRLVLYNKDRLALRSWNNDNHSQSECKDCGIMYPADLDYIKNAVTSAKCDDRILRWVDTGMFMGMPVYVIFKQHTLLIMQCIHRNIEISSKISFFTH